MIAGKVTIEGTARYRDRLKNLVSPSHFRSNQGWNISSIGLGTYLGEADDSTDSAYDEAVYLALSSGCNLLDTAINYRNQRSERAIGSALQRAVSDGIVARDEVVISTKGGFLPFDGDTPVNPSRYIHEEYIVPGVARADEIAAGCHCMSPGYMANQLERSLRNLNLECVDIYFVHNPETQLSEISPQDFLKRVRETFRFLEGCVADGKIQIYGFATWNGFRESSRSRGYLSLEEAVGLARDVGGENHHFRALQLPYNLAMPEAFLTRNQMYGSEAASIIEAAEKQKFVVLSSASILQGRLAGNLPDYVRGFFENLKTDAQKSIQFVRSTPGVTAALIGMSNSKHVLENMEVARHDPLDPGKMKELLS